MKSPTPVVMYYNIHFPSNAWINIVRPLTIILNRKNGDSIYGVMQENLKKLKISRIKNVKIQQIDIPCPQIALA